MIVELILVASIREMFKSKDDQRNFNTENNGRQNAAKDFPQRRNDSDRLTVCFIVFSTVERMHDIEWERGQSIR